MGKAINLCFAVLLVVSGCASFGGHSPEISSFPETNIKPTLLIKVKFRQFINDEPNYMFSENGRAMLTDKIIERFNMSNMFGNVGDDIKNPEYTLEVNIENRGDASMIMAFLTGISLYVIPSCATDDYKLEAKLINNKTEKVNKITMKDSITTCQQLLLLFVMPFKCPISEIKTMQDNFVDNLALNVNEAIQRN